MTALAAVIEPERRWTPLLDPSRYERTAMLTIEERDALALLEAHRNRWPAGTARALERLIGPIDDALDVIASHPAWWGRSSTRSLLLGGAREHGLAFWGWDRDQWLHTVRAANNNYRQAVAAVAYLLCDQRGLHRAFGGWKTRLLTRRVSGPKPVDGALGRVQGYLDELGSATVLQRPNMQGALYELMILAGSPLLEDLGEQGELLVWLRSQETNNARRHGVEQLTRTLVDMRVMARMPFATQPSREEWLDRSQAGEIDVPLVWLAWTRRWFETSPLSLSTRRHTYYALIRAGRWLHAEHPDRADPESWDRELAAEWIATVDRLKSGSWPSRRTRTGCAPARRGSVAALEGVADRIGATVLLQSAGVGVDRAAVRSTPRARDPQIDRGADRPRPARHRRRGLGQADVGRAEPRPGRPPQTRQQGGNGRAVVSA